MKWIVRKFNSYINKSNYSESIDEAIYSIQSDSILINDTIQFELSRSKLKLHIERCDTILERYRRRQGITHNDHILNQYMNRIAQLNPSVIEYNRLLIEIDNQYINLLNELKIID